MDWLNPCQGKCRQSSSRDGRREGTSLGGPQGRQAILGEPGSTAKQHVFFFCSKDLRDHIKCIISDSTKSIHRRKVESGPTVLSTTPATPPKPPPKPTGQTFCLTRHQAIVSLLRRWASSSPTSARFNKSGPVQGGPCPALPCPSHNCVLLVASLLAARPDPT